MAATVALFQFLEDLIPPELWPLEEMIPYPECETSLWNPILIFPLFLYALLQKLFRSFTLNKKVGQQAVLKEDDTTIAMGTTSAFMSEVIEAALDASDTNRSVIENDRQDWQEDIDRLYSYLEDERMAKVLAAQELEEYGTATDLSNTTLGSECIACTETVSLADLATVPCSHRYCRTCITRLFQEGLKAGMSWPPQCCSVTIPTSLARPIIGPRLSRQAAKKDVEQADHNRTYCVGKQCGRYVPARARNDIIRKCAQCGMMTCTACKEQAHSGECLTPDQTFLDLAHEKKWQRCPNCGHVVERTSGCRIVRCRCGCPFCHVCGRDPHLIGCGPIWQDEWW